MMNLTDLCVSWMYFCLQNLMEHFNPGLQKLVALGNTYVKAFQGERAGLVWWIKFREYMKLGNLTLIYAVQYKGMYVNVMSAAQQAIL